MRRFYQNQSIMRNCLYFYTFDNTYKNQATGKDGIPHGVSFGNGIGGSKPRYSVA